MGIQLPLSAQKKEVAAAKAELQALNEGEPETNPSIVDEELVQKGTAQYILKNEPTQADPISHQNELAIPNQQTQQQRLIPRATPVNAPTQPLQTPEPRSNDNNSHGFDLTKFLLRKELTLSMLTNFNDKCEKLPFMEMHL